MPFKPGLLVLDSVSGWIDASIAELLGDEPKPHTYTSLRYNVLMGGWHRDFRVMRQIYEKHGIKLGVTGHIKHRETWRTVGFDGKGAPIKDGTVDAWSLNIPGRGEEAVRAAFDEVWLMTATASEASINPNRKLHTQPILWESVKFEAKTRKGIPTGITNPTWESVMKQVPKGRDEPESILLMGAAGVGKTTFFASALEKVGSILFLDLMGGCSEEAKKEGIRVLYPKKPSEVFDTLKVLRDKGELP